MKHQASAKTELSAEEIRFLEQLRTQPELLARFQNILNLTSGTEGPLKTADQAEALVVEELRQLGHATMTHWALRAEVRVAKELRSQDPTVRSRKKKRWLAVRPPGNSRGIPHGDPATGLTLLAMRRLFR